MPISGPLEASWVAFWVHFGVILGCFLGAPGGKQEFVKNRTACRRELEKSRFRGSKISKNRVRKQHPAATGPQERFGRPLGSIFEPFGGHFGTQNRSGRGSENELDFESIFKRPPGGAGSSDKGSAGLEEDRRGGVGEG